MNSTLMAQKDFCQLVGVIEPTRAVLKTRRKDLQATLREINHYSSFFGTVRRFIGRTRIHEQCILNTITMLPRITVAIADDLQDKTQQLDQLCEEQLQYVTTINGKIEDIVQQNSTPPPPMKYGDLAKKIRSKNAEEVCTAYAAFTQHFPEWSAQRLTAQLHEDAMKDLPQYREEALFNLIGCNYLRENIKIIADNVQRRVDHLHYTLDTYQEIIVLGRDLRIARKGLREVAEKGNKVYQAVQESYLRLEQIMMDLRNPQRLLP